MKRHIIAAFLASVVPMKSAVAAAQEAVASDRQARELVRADAWARGLHNATKIIITGDSFTILESIHSLRPIERVMATGTIDRISRRVKSFNPILMD